MKIPHVLVTTALISALFAACGPSAAFQTAETKTADSSGSIDTSAKLEPAKNNTPADCPVTISSVAPFEAPQPYSPAAPWPNIFWFGSKALWTALPTNGIWSGLPLNPGGYTQKILWWSELFSIKDEPQPDLVVAGERLDADAPALKVSRATNAYADDIGNAMLVGVDFPTLGCWRISGQYRKTSLSFLVWVSP